MDKRRASKNIQMIAASPRQRISTVIDRLAGLTRVSCQKSRFTPAIPRPDEK